MASKVKQAMKRDGKASRGRGGKRKAGPSRAHVALKQGTGVVRSRTPQKSRTAHPGVNGVGVVEVKPAPVESTDARVEVIPLPPKIARDALIRDFGNEQPPPGAWREWVEIKAGLYGLTVDQAYHTLERLMAGFQSAVRANLHSEAMSIGKAIGGLRLKAVRALEAALNATREVGGGIDKEGKVVLPESEPDHRTRLAAYDRVERLFGMAAPSKMEVEHEIGDRYAALTEAELQLEGAKLLKGMLDAFNLKQERKQINASGEDKGQ